MTGHGDLVPDVGCEVACVGELEVSDSGEEAVFDLLLADETITFVFLKPACSGVLAFVVRAVDRDMVVWGIVIWVVVGR